MSYLDRTQFQLLARTLDASAFRQKVIANNIANNDTPQFKRADVQFEALLRNELKTQGGAIEAYRTHHRHIAFGAQGRSDIQPKVLIDESTLMNNNLNNVDIDAEMALMAENQIRYNAIVQQVSTEFKLLRAAIEGR